MEAPLSLGCHGRMDVNNSLSAFLMFNAKDKQIEKEQKKREKQFGEKQTQIIVGLFRFGRSINRYMSTVSIFQIDLLI